jgi:heme oxygenase
MKARFALRQATAAEHERVDCLFSRLDLARADHYRLFLTAQACAQIPVEAALDAAGAQRLVEDWPARRRSHLLIADLRDLRLQIPAPEEPPALTSDEAILGAVYVLEGSRLGGAVLKRSLPDTVPKRFLTAPQPQGSWRKLLETLDHFLYETSAIESASGAAKQVFQCFEAGGLRFLESKVE